MSKINPLEISSLIKEQIRQYEKQIKTEKIEIYHELLNQIEEELEKKKFCQICLSLSRNF